MKVVQFKYLLNRFAFKTVPTNNLPCKTTNSLNKPRGSNQWQLLASRNQCFVPIKKNTQREWKSERGRERKRDRKRQRERHLIHVETLICFMLMLIKLWLSKRQHAVMRQTKLKLYGHNLHIFGGLDKNSYVAWHA